MSDFIKLIGAIGDNADKLGSVGILLLGFGAFVYALFKEEIVTGKRYREMLRGSNEYKEALTAANAELDSVKEALIRLQVEKEYGWNPPITRSRRVRQ